MIPLLTTFLAIGSLETATENDRSSFSELSYLPPATANDPFNEKIQTIFNKVSEKTLYYCAGQALSSVSLLARLGWGICLITPWASTLGNECLLLSQVFGCVTEHIFAHLFKGSRSSAAKNIPTSQQSWYLNQALLSRVPSFSSEEKQLLLFLEKRWLAKSSGIYSELVDWIFPCFGISVQVPPDTTGFYARDPGKKFPPAYIKRVEDWKHSLPHPQHFPLVLTRPSDLQGYLPAYFEVPQGETIQTTVERLALKMESGKDYVVVDLTQVVPDPSNDRENWCKEWEAYRTQLTEACQEQRLNLSQILCIQNLQKKQLGGIRLLPLFAQSAQESEEQHQYLLKWISIFGLSANRIELDRWQVASNTTLYERSAPAISSRVSAREEFVFYLDSFEKKWKSNHPQKTLMLKGTLQVLKGLLSALSEDKWVEIMNSPTRSSIVQLSFSKIKEQLKLLAKEEKTSSFFSTASEIEQIHGDITSLLEIFSPFTANDFPEIYRKLLLSIPSNLKPLTSYGIHSCGMASLAGIFKATEKTLGKSPRVLYGENSYFENIHAASQVAIASSIQEATDDDWKEVDLILAQFNPVLKRIDFEISEYGVEKIAETLHKTLNVRHGKPLTLAIDCTFDFIDSPRVNHILFEFEKEIERGTLNVICYRSGLKFDLFGMDNYCGAPLFMIHKPIAYWASFDALLSDPVLQTDRLSLNWFCLAYQNAASELELYRKQIFDNTKALLHKVPKRLLNNSVNYRIIPMDPEADLAFIDIKVFGPLHEIRASLFIGGFLTTHCLSAGHPIFYRPSVGFYHPNFTILYGKDCSTIRLTLGLDPAQIDLLAKGFEKIDTLNGRLR